MHEPLKKFGQGVLGDAPRPLDTNSGNKSKKPEKKRRNTPPPKKSNNQPPYIQGG